MAETAAALVDRVLPAVPVRQWVLTLPYPLRYRCAWDARLTSEVLRAFLRALFADQRRRARRVHGISRGHCGSVTFIQRFGSALNLTPHFHTLVLDGVYPGPSHDLGSFVPLPPPETDDVERVLAGTARRIIRILERRGFDPDEDSVASNDPLLALLTAASIRSRIATGPEAGESWRRLGDRVEPVEAGEGDPSPGNSPPPRCVRHGGMSLHADVDVPAHDRRRLERLCRYVARPPLVIDRLESMVDGRLAYRLKTRWRDGTTHVVMERHELLERLAPLIPPPRAHQVRYHGVLAPCASGRDCVVPSRTERIAACSRAEPWAETETKFTAKSVSPVKACENRDGSPLNLRSYPDPVAASGESMRRRPLPEPPSIAGVGPGLSPARRVAWADLLQRVFEIDALHCPTCGGRMRVLSAITDPIVASRILRCLSLPPRAPPQASAKDGEPAPGRVGEEWLGEVPNFDFDQSPPSGD